MMERATFGKVIAGARKAQQLNQKELAGLIVKEDGQAISPQYLNDIEHDRRSPSSDVIHQLANRLKLDADYLHILVGKWPADLPAHSLKEKDVASLMVAFRKKVDR